MIEWYVLYADDVNCMEVMSYIWDNVWTDVRCVLSIDVWDNIWTDVCCVLSIDAYVVTEISEFHWWSKSHRLRYQVVRS